MDADVTPKLITLSKSEYDELVMIAESKRIPILFIEVKVINTGRFFRNYPPFFKDMDSIEAIKDKELIDQITQYSNEIAEHTIDILKKELESIKSKWYYKLFNR